MARRPIVHYPAEVERSRFTGALYGLHHPDSNEYNVTAFGDEVPGGHPRIGRVELPAGGGNGTGGSGGSDAAAPELVGTWKGDALTFRSGTRACTAQPYDLKLDLFSRNTGILETDRMLDRRVLVSGCGSVGSLVALELARAGVGHFFLVDPDTLAYHNLSRHQCGTADVGKFKVHAVRERILQINPAARVTALATSIERVAKEDLDAFFAPGSLIVGCADNREGDVWANRIACEYGAAFVSIGCWERAFAGEIFYTIPGRMPCYDCPFGGRDSISQRPSENRRFYTTEADLAEAAFMPGISTDIGYVTTVGIKVILDLLNLSFDDYTPRVLNDLTQFTLVCNTNDVSIAGEQAEIFAYPLQVTRSIAVEYRAPCPPCRLTSHGTDQQKR